MGKASVKNGGKGQNAQLDRWKTGKDATWNMMNNETEVKTQLLWKRRITGDRLNDETAKRQMLENQVDSLQKTIQKQEVEILNLKLGNNSVPHRSHKPWSDISRQQQHHQQRKMAKDLNNITSFCDSNYKPCNIEVQNIETGNHEIINFAT